MLRNKGQDKGPKLLARMTDDERQRMLDLQYNWEQLVQDVQRADLDLTGFRQFIRTRYELPRHYTIDLASGEITEAPEVPVNGEGTEEEA